MAWSAETAGPLLPLEGCLALGAIADGSSGDYHVGIQV